jgi:hypothetical protein
MSPTTLIQLALNFMRFANWIASRVSQAEWKRMGKLEAAQEQADIWKKTIGLADAAVTTAQKATPQERKDILEQGL